MSLPPTGYTLIAGTGLVGHLSAVKVNGGLVAARRLSGWFTAGDRDQSNAGQDEGL
jgi:hypothetical protein